MIKFISSWVKGLGLAIVIVSILEMLLPNNKTKKYIRTVMGIYVLFTMISPFINERQVFQNGEFNLEQYATEETSRKLDQSSMNERIQELYIQQLEKDVAKKLKEKGYEAITCKVKVQIADKEEETKITKIKLKVQKIPKEEQEQKEESENLENKIVTEVQKIKPVDTSIQKESQTNQLATSKKDKEMQISRVDIQNIKKFLMEEYGVNEKCLEIN